MAAPKGIYEIISKVNGRKYIGSSDNIYRRWRIHKHTLLRGVHHSVILQRHVNKYGIGDLIFSILEECEIGSLVMKEQSYIDNNNPYFNIRKIADSNRGIIRSEETREKLRNIHLGKRASDNTKRKMAVRMIGNSLTKGVVPVNARKLIDTKTNIIYNSIPMAARELGMKPRTLRAMIDGQNPNKTNLRIAS